MNVFPFKFNGIDNVETVNFPVKLEYIFGNISFILLFTAVLLYWFDFYNTKQQLKTLKKLAMIGANLALTFLLITRWFVSGHFPLSNLYESLIGLSWSFTTVHLIIILKITNKLEISFKEENDKIGAITAPTALLTSVFATFFLPPEMLKATALIPALKSNWLTMHVTVMLISYGFLLVGSLLSIAFCAYKFSSKLSFKDPTNFTERSNVSLGFDSSGGSSKEDFFMSSSLEGPGKKVKFLGSGEDKSFNIKYLNSFLKKNKSILSTEQENYSFENIPNFKLGVFVRANNKKLDYLNLNQQLFGDNRNTINSNHQEETNKQICLWLNTTSYRILGLGFPLLTIGILSGAVWANEAWGSYWSWDPKETWALITWLVFAVYFHSRYNRSLDDSVVPATIASIGFVVIWICYLGVNLLQSGLHSYGWFTAFLPLFKL